MSTQTFEPKPTPSAESGADRLHGGRRDPAAACRGARPAGAGSRRSPARESPVQDARGEAVHRGTARYHYAAVRRSDLETRKAGARRARRAWATCAEAVPTPNVKAFQTGKEYGNNGQCNPTYFTVGNLVQYLQNLEEQGLTKQEIIDRYVFFTAGACGPCRFGMYEAEYRLALRNAGFRRFPRAAVPAVRRAEPVGCRSRPGDEPGFLPGHPQCAQLRRRDERSGLRVAAV